MDEVAAHHNTCYDMGKNKDKCVMEMVKSLDEIPYRQMSMWGQTAQFLINTKQKIGLDVKKSKNGKIRWMRKKLARKTSQWVTQTHKT